MIEPIPEIYIYTNGVLLSRRYITTEDGTPITRADIASVTLNIYKLSLASNGSYSRTLQASSELTIADVITETVQEDTRGNKYNFRYCVEGVFLTPNTLYLVEYKLTTTDNHTIIVVAKGRTLD